MRLPLLLAILLAAAGCSAKPAPPVPDVYLEDASGDATPRYDILRANFTELNGSLVLRVEFLNYAEGLPLVDARIDTSIGDFYTRLVLEPGRVRAEQGRWIGSERREAAETCWLRSLPTRADAPGPWLIFLELLNNRTGLDQDGGATVRSLSIVATDPNGTVQDEATHEGDFRVLGGVNPYEDCPLNHERARLE